MAIEVEIKAHINEPDRIYTKLCSLFTLKRNFSKKDEYWFQSSKNRTVNFPNSGIRLRTETFDDTRGTHSKTFFITWKSKEIQEKTEVNRENELTISDADDFRKLLSLLGLEKTREKQKTGHLFVKEDIKAELSDVEGLGFFIEIEIMAENPEEDHIKAAKKRLYECLKMLEIDEEAIETRFYSEMLEEKD